MNCHTISFKIENKLSGLRGLHREVEAFAKAHQLSAKEIFRINLCLEEHFANIVSHAYIDCETHWIEITLAVEKDHLSIRFEDDGIPFNPTEIPDPDFKCPLETRKIGGLGVHLTRHYMDTIVYQRRNNRNMLVMTKKLHLTDTAR